MPESATLTILRRAEQLAERQKDRLFQEFLQSEVVLEQIRQTIRSLEVHREQA